MSADLPAYPSMDEILKDGKPCNDSEEVRRKIEIADMKEIYSKEYMLKHGLCTPKEYDSIPASTTRADDLRRAQDIASLMGKVVGAEEPW